MLVTFTIYCFNDKCIVYNASLFEKKTCIKETVPRSVLIGNYTETHRTRGYNTYALNLNPVLTGRLSWSLKCPV